MTIVVTGGGSGGHITPILAVARELKKLDPTLEIVYIGEKGDGLSDIPAEDPHIDTIVHVRAGKFRRYPSDGWKQFIDIQTLWLNLRDGVSMLTGIWQSYWLLRKLKPAIIFTRGSYVSVPVTLAGAMQGIPYVTHDSDAIPSLTNRLIARWASIHAVALPEEVYPYPIDKTETVGTPIGSEYVPVTPALTAQYRQELGLDGYEHVLFVTGGGNGARHLNQVVVANAAELLKQFPRLVIVHTSGRALEAETVDAYDAVLAGADKRRVIVRGFVKDFFRYSGAADVIIARGSATNLAEFAVQAKAVVSIPAPQLAWTIKNTETLARNQALVMLTEDQADQELRLAHTLAPLLADPQARAALGRTLAGYGRPDAGRRIAELLLETAASSHKPPQQS